MVESGSRGWGSSWVVLVGVVVGRVGVLVEFDTVGEGQFGNGALNINARVKTRTSQDMT